MKKGFTLIELLAVIVILAIIALIATPIIISIIENTKGESEKRSIELYASAIKNAIASYQLNENESLSGIFTTTDGKALTLMGETEPKLTMDYNGDVVCTTMEIYEDGNIYLADCTVNGQSVDYTYGTQQEVFKICEFIDDTYGQKGQVGAKYNCHLDVDRTFYLLETNLTNATLIMDRNLIGWIPWASEEDFALKDPERYEQLINKDSCIPNGYCGSENTYGPITIIKEINKLNWKNVIVDIPSEEQIKNAYSGSMPIWLYDHLEADFRPGGYWTSTRGNYGSETARVVEVYYEECYVGGDECYGDDCYEECLYERISEEYVGGHDNWHGSISMGFRPTITISTNQLN